MEEAYSHSMVENLVTWPHRRDAGAGGRGIFLRYHGPWKKKKMDFDGALVFFSGLYIPFLDVAIVPHLPYYFSI